MVELSDAVSHPRTMMIHPDDALVADRAVMDSSFFNHIALEAEAGFVEGFDFLEINFPYDLILASFFLLLRLLPCINFQFLHLIPIIDVLS
jgi:hypothetical protein